MCSLRVFLLAALNLGFAFVGTVYSQTTYTWQGTTNGNWGTGTNWVGGVAPVDASSGTENIVEFTSASTSNLTTIMNLTSGQDLSLIRILSPTGTVTIQSVLNSSRTIDLLPATANATTIDMSSATQDLIFANNGSGIMGLNVAGGAQTWNVVSGRTLTTTSVTGSTTNILTITGGGTLVLGGTSDNASLRLTLTGAGTLVTLAKTPSTPSVHALGGGATTLINAGTELRITGTGNDQIFYQHDLQVDGKFNLNGKSEGMDALSSGTGVTTGVVTSSVAGAVTLRLSEGGGAGTYGGVIEDGAGTLSVFKTHTGTQVFAGNNTYTGTTTVSRGLMQIYGASGALAGTSGVIIDAFGELRLDSRGAATNGFNPAANSNRLNNSATVSLQGGIFSLHGLSGTTLIEEIGAVTATLGVNHIRMSSDTTGSDVTGFSASDFSRQAGAQVIFFGDNTAGFGAATTGDVVFFRVATGALGAADIAGASGTGVNRDVVIGAYGSSATTSANGGEFMTVENSGGFDYLRPLVAAEYASLTSGQVGESVALQTANTNITANTAYNALKLTGGNTILSASKTLYLGGHGAAVDANPLVTDGAGMVLATNTGGIVGLRSTLDFAGREAIFRVLAGNLNVESSISGSAGLSKTGNGILNLTGRNTFTGAVYVNEGILQVRNDKGLGATGGNVYVNGSASTTLLQLSNGVNIVGEDLTLGASNNTNQVGFRSNSGHNTWAGDVILSNVNLGGNSSAASQIQVGANAALTLFGDVYGMDGTSPADSTYYGSDGSFTRRLSFENSLAGVINFRGSLKDIESGASANRKDWLRLEMNTADLTVNFAKQLEVTGFVYLRQGYMRYEGEGNMFATSTGTTDRIIHIDATGTGSEVAVLLTKAGQSFSRTTTSTAPLTIGNNNNTTTTNVLLGGENESGVVTFGDGTQRMDLQPRTTDDAASVGIADTFRDVRLYATAGGEVNIRMEIMEDTGFGLDNEIGAITKVGRGTVRLTGKTATNNDVDGGVYALGGTLLLDYGTINNVKVQVQDGAQFTAAGGDVRLVKSNTGSVTERMTGNLTVRAGGSEVSVDSVTGGTVTLALAGLTGSTVDRRVGGTLNFVTSGTGTSSITLTRDTTGPRSVRLGSWATFGTVNNTASQWAFINSSGNITGYTHTGGELNTFGAGLNTDLAASAALSGATVSNSLRINDSAVTSLDLGGSSLTLTEGGILIGSGHNAALTIDNGSLTSGGQDLIVQNYGAGSVAITADITGNVSFTHGGTGVTTLIGAKTFAGTVYLGGGVLSVSQDSSLGNSANGLYLNGGTLRTTSDMASARTVILGGDGGRFDVSGTSTTTLTGVVASEANFIYTETNASTGTVVNVANTGNVGVGDLIKTGSGMLVIDNIASASGATNTYRGLTDIREGTLRVALAGSTSFTYTSLGTNESWLDGTIVRGGATLEFFKPSNSAICSIEEWVRLENNSTLKVTGGRLSLNGVTEVNGSVTFNIGSGGQLDLSSAGYVSGSGDILKTGTGSLVMLGNNSLFTGAITVNEGTLTARGQGQNTGSNFTAAITLTGSGSYRRLSVNEFTNHVLVEDHDFVVNGTSGNKIAVGNDSTPTGDDIFEFNGDISLLSDLSIASEMQINPASSGLRTSYSRFNGAFSGSRNLSTSVAIGTAADQRRGVFEFNGANTGWTGSLTVGNAGNDVNKLHVVRMGNVQGIGAANNVILRHNSTFQVGGLGVTVGNLSTTGAAGATSTEVIENASHVAGTLTVTQAVDASWDAYFRDGTPVGTLYETEDVDPAASLSIVKAGAATATLTLDNAYTGSTTVQSGTLQVGSGGSKTARAVGDTGTGATTTVLSVNSGATVAGTGTIVGIRDTVTPATTTTHVLQGTLRPGDVQGSAVTPGDFTNLGTLAVKGNLDARGGTFAFQMGGASMRVDTAFAALEVGSSSYNSYLTANVGTWEESATAANRFDHDFLDIDGQLLLNGESSFIATFTTGYNPVAGTVIDLMDWAGVLGGTGFDVGQNFRSGGAGGGDLYLPTLVNPTLYYDVSQFATNGIILVVTPEPGRTLLLLLGMFGMVWTRRRRN